MLMPAKTKYRKVHRGRRAGKASGCTTLALGDYGLQALQPCWLTNRQIESARVAMTRHVRRAGKVWIRVFPDHAVTKKPAETRMGGGKGAPEGWVAIVKPGRILFEMSGIDPTAARDALKLAGYKLPIRTRIIMREEIAGVRT